jgi:hypothetical protein
MKSTLLSSLTGHWLLRPLCEALGQQAGRHSDVLPLPQRLLELCDVSL